MTSFRCQSEPQSGFIVFLKDRYSQCTFFRRQKHCGPWPHPDSKCLTAVLMHVTFRYCVIRTDTVCYCLILPNTWNCLILPDTAWYCLILPDTNWYCLILPKTIEYFLIPLDTAWHYSIQLILSDTVCRPFTEPILKSVHLSKVSKFGAGFLIYCNSAHQS